MAKNRFTDREFRALLKQAGKHGDGGKLYLRVGDDGNAKWLFLFRRNGQSRAMGLGRAGIAAGDVGLAEARQRRDDAAEVLKSGRDPIDVRRQEAAAAEAAAKRPTFGEFADEFVTTIEVGFRNAVHREQWRSTLSDAYCRSLRAKFLDEITTDDVLAVLKPIWLSKNETANRIRARIERVLAAASARGLRTGVNPAAWRGHLKELLPARQKLQRGHHPAMPYPDLPAFWKRLAALDSMSARAVQFTILTGARSGETRGATWGEFDLEAKVWRLPARRMKAGREHTVPLSDEALAILQEVEVFAPEGEARASAITFATRKGTALSDMALGMCVRGMVTGATVHGFRSTFRDWVGDETDHPREVVEAALAHVVGSATERAYRRASALEKRRVLMAEWAAFVVGKDARPSAQVIRFPARA